MNLTVLGFDEFNVMASGKVVTVEFFCFLEQGTEFDNAVTVNAGIWGFASAVLSNEVVNDVFFEGVR